ncbi:hypothetical protein GQ55_4G322900 [Panicum hallii var. hallii]|uniref:Uncharacterized protein n=1 Tax=Panicum hallii var. hallii TaxID=1504633 RepID=A0A2T7E2E5_9POAL|nr:hypothetical protein GQ55_4G322900 [Panicum hallii var. hallii]
MRRGLEKREMASELRAGSSPRREAATQTASVPACQTTPRARSPVPSPRWAVIPSAEAAIGDETTAPRLPQSLGHVVDPLHPCVRMAPHGAPALALWPALIGPWRRRRPSSGVPNR